jgi:hypothetical protein
MPRRRHLRKSRLRRKKSIFRNRFFWLFLLIIIFSGTIFDLATFYSFFQIKEIEITGNQKVSVEDIKSVISGKISKKVVFQETKSIFLQDLKGIARNIGKEFPQIAEIKIKRVFPDTVLAEVIERQTVATWCRGSDCFYADKDGVIFEKTEEVKSPLVRFEIDVSDFSLGKPVLDKKYFDTILKINNELENMLNVKIKEFVSSVDGKKLVAETKQGWKIIFNLEGDISIQVSNLDVALKEKIPQQELKNLLYIDLRYGNRIYYKYSD